MKRKLVKALSLAVVGSTIISSGTSFAATTKNVKATYDNIKVVSDGVDVDLKGKAQPVILDGKLYLPISTVESAATRYSVKYDNNSKTVNFTDISSVQPQTNQNNTDEANNAGGSVLELTEFTEKYYQKRILKGVYHDGRYYSMGKWYEYEPKSSSNEGYDYINVNNEKHNIINCFRSDSVEIDINKEINSVEFMLASEDSGQLSGKVTIMGDDKVLYRSDVKYGDSIKHEKVNLKSVKKLKIIAPKTLMFDVKFNMVK